MTEIYNSHCFAFSPCSQGASIAGIYDYVGAVYGEAGKVKFDGELTDAEKAYVLEKFGELADLNALPAYMKQARQYLFDHVTEYRVMKDIGLCQPEKFSLSEGTHPVYGEALVLAGAHACGALYGELFAPIEFEIAQAPEDWVLFVENVHHSRKNRFTLEQILFLRLAERLGIELHDPILPMNHPTILKELEKKGIKKLVFACYITALAYTKAQKNLIATEGEEAVRDQKKSDQLFRDHIDQFSELFGVPLEELRRGAKRLLNLPDNEFIAAQNIADQLIAEYGQLADELSPPLVQESLQKSSKSRVFFQIGEGHLPVPKALFTLGPSRRPLVQD